MIMAPIGLYILMIGPQLVELFRKDQEVWPVQGCVLVGTGFEVSKDSCRSQCAVCLQLLEQDVSFELFLLPCLH